MSHSIINLISECEYPKGYSLAFVIYGVVITFLFMNFYRKSYNTQVKSKTNGVKVVKKEN
jgi:hypothetical protein